MTYPHSECDNPSCDKPARVDSRYCSLACLNEHAALQEAADADPGDEHEDWVIR